MRPSLWLADQRAGAVEHVFVGIAPPDLIVPAEPFAAGVVKDKMSVMLLGEHAARARPRPRPRRLSAAGAAPVVHLAAGLRLGAPCRALVVDLAQDHVDLAGNVIAARVETFRRNPGRVRAQRRDDAVARPAGRAHGGDRAEQHLAAIGAGRCTVADQLGHLGRQAVEVCAVGAGCGPAARRSLRRHARRSALDHWRDVGERPSSRTSSVTVMKRLAPPA